MVKVFLSAGHGGSDPGATAFGLREKDINLQTLLACKETLEAHGVTVVASRTTDENDPVAQEVREANASGAVVAVSFHANAGGGDGFEGLCYPNDQNGARLAALGEKYVMQLGQNTRGIKTRKDLMFLNSTKMTAVLFESFFVDNDKDNDIGDTVEKQRAFGVAYAKAILEYLEIVYKGSGAAPVVPHVPASPSAPAPSKKDLGHVDCVYQVFTDRWWPPVWNKNDWAGQGDKKAIRYLAIRVSKGSVRARVFTEKSGWLPYLTFGNSYNLNDLENGVLGDGSPIRAVELYYYTPGGYFYKKIAYRVSDQNHTTFYPVQKDNEKGNGMDGYAGTFNTWIDKFQAWIE